MSSMNSIIMDAFKALDSINDDIVTKDLRRKGVKVNESKLKPVSGGAKKGLKESDSRLYVYQFFPLKDRDIEAAEERYGLVFIGTQGPKGFQPGDTCIRGTLKQLERFCDEYLGYEMHPDYLCPADSFDDEFLECLKRGRALKKAVDDKKVNEAIVNLNDNEEVAKARKVMDSKEEPKKEETIVDVDAETVDQLKDSYVGNAILRCPVCRTLIYKQPEDLKKDGDNELYNVEEECPHCHTKDGFELVGQVAEMSAAQAEEESDEGDTTGKSNDAEPKGQEDDKDKEDEHKRPSRIEAEESMTREFVLESIDEERFDKLVNQYLSATYSNVESYQTTDGKVDNKNNIVVLEGSIKYKSGKEKQTTFVFEAKSSTKNGRLRFVGMNESFAKTRNAFSLYGRVSKSGCLKSESLHYSYGVKSLGESLEVKGKAEIKQRKPRS